MAKITMLGTGLIGTFYTQTIHGTRSRDRVVNVYSRSAERAKALAAEKGIPRWSTNLREAVLDSDSEGRYSTAAQKKKAAGAKAAAPGEAGRDAGSKKRVNKGPWESPGWEKGAG